MKFTPIVDARRTDASSKSRYFTAELATIATCAWGSVHLGKRHCGNLTGRHRDAPKSCDGSRARNTSGSHSGHERSTYLRLWRPTTIQSIEAKCGAGEKVDVGTILRRPIRAGNIEYLLNGSRFLGSKEAADREKYPIGATTNEAMAREIKGGETT